MSDRRELKAKIRGVRSTEKLTGAMRTISTANYAKAVAAWGSFRTYADACDGMLREAGDAGFPRDPGAGDAGKGKVCFVVLTGNRALCGSYNEEVAGLFARCLRDDPGADVIFCGKWGSIHISPSVTGRWEDWPVSDVPSWSEAAALADRLRTGYESGRYSRVDFVTQQQRNLLIRKPVRETFLPAGADGGRDTAGGPPAGDHGFVFFPGREETARALAEICFRGKVYGALIGAAAGVQGATMFAMKNSNDNSRKLREQLETELQRLRQSSVTEGVIETSVPSGNGR